LITTVAVVASVLLTSASKQSAPNDFTISTVVVPLLSIWTTLISFGGSEFDGTIT
jgi:hypothetical protein